MSKIFAQLDDNNVVTNILEGDDSDTDLSVSKRTNSTCMTVNEGIGIGYIWQSENNRFISRQPYDDWTLNLHGQSHCRRDYHCRACCCHWIHLGDHWDDQIQHSS